MLVLAFVLPTLVFATPGRASPPKTTTENLYIKTNLVQVVSNYQITASYKIIAPAVIVNTTLSKNIDQDNLSISLLEADKPAKSLYLNLRQSGKDAVGWQSSFNGYKNQITGYPVLLKLEIRV